MRRAPSRGKTEVHRLRTAFATLIRRRSGACRAALPFAVWLALGPGAVASAAQAPPDGGAPTGAGPAGAAPHQGVTPLTDEATLTTWAQPEVPGQIYLRPTPHARVVAPVKLYTEDGFPNVYLLLSGYLDAAGREWMHVRIPGRPNGRTGWMLRELLGALHHTRWRIVINRQHRQMRIYYDGGLRRIFPISVGKPSTPTPPGRFWLRERFRLRDHSSPYWPYALGTTDYSALSEWPGGGVVGIHGDFGEPSKIPGAPSHGCIRMHDPDIAWLAPRVSLGTPVDII